MYKIINILKRRKNIIIFFLSFASVFIFASAALAQGNPFGLQYGAATGLGGQDIRLTIAKIIRIFLGLLGIIALVLILYGGFIYMTSKGDADKVEEAKKIIVNSVIGLAIILSSFALVQFVFDKLSSATDFAGSNGSGGPACSAWDCPPPGSCLARAFVVKSLTPHGTITGSELRVNNIVLRAVFSQDIAQDIPAEEVFRVIRGELNSGTDVSSQFNFAYLTDSRKVVEATPRRAVGPDFLIDSGDYHARISSDLRDTNGVRLATNACNQDFPQSSSFNVQTSTGLDVNPPTIGMVPNSGRIAFDGNIMADIALPVGGTYAVTAPVTDNSGYSYARLSMARADGSDPFVWYEGPYTVGQGSWSPSTTPPNHLVFSHDLFIPPGRPTGLYTMTLTVYDIDHRSINSLTQVINIVPAYCNFGIGDGEGADCVQNGACSSGVAPACTPNNALCSSRLCGINCLCSSSPIITKIDPANAAPGNWVTIFGRDFGSNGEVSFGYDASGNGTIEATEWHIAEIVSCGGSASWNDKWIIARVPSIAGANVGAQLVIRVKRGAGAYTIDNFDTSDNERGAYFLFTISTNQYPGLCAVNALEDDTRPGKRVQVIGQKFEPSDSSRYVSFGGVQSNNFVSGEWTEGTIITKVPLNMNPGWVGVAVFVSSTKQSNSLPFHVDGESDTLLPLVAGLSPSSTTMGSYVTITGARFGTTTGKVYLSTDSSVAKCDATNTRTAQNTTGVCHLAIAALSQTSCGTTWTDKQVIFQVPEGLQNLPLRYSVIVENGDNQRQNKTRDQILEVRPGPAQLSICRLDPRSGPAPLPAGSAGLNMVGVGADFPASLSSNPIVYFSKRESQVNNWNTFLAASTSAFLSVPSNDTVHISGIPVDGFGYSAKTGPVFLRAGGSISNGITYTVNDCRENKEIFRGTADYNRYQCCETGPDSGRWLSTNQVCAGEVRQAGYVWRFTTGAFPSLPHVVEGCDQANWNNTARRLEFPSPTPWENWQQGKESCLNSSVAVMFSTRMDPSTFSSGVRLLKCGNGTVPNSDCTSRPVEDLTSSVWNLPSRYSTDNVLTILSNPTFDPNTWYRVVLLDTIKSNETVTELATTTIKSEFLEKSRPCGVGTAYCFDFKTKNVSGAGGNCNLIAAGIRPSEYIARSLGLILDPSYPPELRHPFYFYLWGRGNQVCSVMPVDGLGWHWTVERGSLPLALNPVNFASVSLAPSSTLEPGFYTDTRAKSTAFLQTSPNNVALRAAIDGVVTTTVRVPTSLIVTSTSIINVTTTLQSTSTNFVINDGLIMGGISSGALVVMSTSSAVTVNDPNKYLDLSSSSTFTFGFQLSDLGDPRTMTVAAAINAGFVPTYNGANPANGVQYYTAIRSIANRGNAYTLQVIDTMRTSCGTPTVCDRRIIRFSRFDTGAGFTLDDVRNDVRNPSWFTDRVEYRIVQNGQVVSMYRNTGSGLTLVNSIVQAGTNRANVLNYAQLGAYGAINPLRGTLTKFTFEKLQDQVTITTTVSSTVRITTSSVPGFEDIVSTTYFNTGGFQPTSSLFIALEDPKVVEYWPACYEACVNAEIGLRFNRAMNVGDYASGIQLYECADESCASSSTVNLVFYPDQQIDTILRATPSTTLKTSNYYVLKTLNSGPSSTLRAIDGYISSATGSSIPIFGASLQPFAFKFRTKADGALCLANKVRVTPDPFLARFIGEKTKYSASPYGAPDACSPRGQVLNAWSFGWVWDTLNHNVATVSNFSTAGSAQPFCTLGCLPKGSSIAVSVQPVGLCGNGRVDPGEDCDISASTTLNGVVQNEIPGTSCSLNCLRVGNNTNGASATNLALCGNGNVNPLVGEECDDNNVVSGDGCSNRCLHEGSERTNSNGSPNTPVCGSGTVSSSIFRSAEDCEPGAQVLGGQGIDVLGINCTDRCVHVGTLLARSWCDANANLTVGTESNGGPINAGNTLSCKASQSVCGNGVIESGEECEVFGNTIKIYNLTNILNPIDPNPSVPASSCSSVCLLQNMCRPNLDAPKVLSALTCDRTTEGCTSECTLAGSSVNYSVSSVCGDGVSPTSSGEFLACEATVSSTFSLGQNPVQVITAVGKGSVVEPSKVQITTTTATTVSVRDGVSSKRDLSGTERASGSGVYGLQCGNVEYPEVRTYDDGHGNNGNHYNDCYSPTDGVGANSCCYVRPQRSVSASYPLDETRGVCRNTLIRVTLNGNIDEKTITNNILLAKGSLDNPTIGTVNRGNWLASQGLLSAPGAVTSTEGRVQEAFYFNGINDYLRSSSTPTGPLPIYNFATTSYSFDVWVKTTSTNRGMIIAQGNSSRWYADVDGARGGKFNVFICKTTALPDCVTVASQTRVNDGNWHHVAAVFERGYKLSVYVDGVFESSVDILNYSDNFINGQANPSAFYPINIGANMTLDNFFKGAIDELHLFNRVLSAGEIKNIFDAGGSGFCKSSDNRSPTGCIPRYSGLILNNNRWFDGDFARDDAALGGNCVAIGGTDITNLAKRTLAYADNLSQPTGFWPKLWHGVKSFFINLFGLDAYASTYTDDGSIKSWCVGTVRVSPVVTHTYGTDSNGITTASTTITLSIESALDADSTYMVFLRGGANGIKDTKGVGIKSPDRFQLDDSYVFTTGSEICRLSSVSVEPPSYFYDRPNTSTLFVATAIGQHSGENGALESIQPLPSVYSWNWNWIPQNNDIFRIAADGSVANADRTRIGSQVLEGQLTAAAVATVATDTERPANVGSTYSGLTSLTANFCENPWPQKEYYPFEEGVPAGVNRSNNDGFTGGRFNGTELTPTYLGGRAQYLNFSLGYCADAGKVGDRTDDLPHLRPFVYTRGMPVTAGVIPGQSIIPAGVLRHGVAGVRLDGPHAIAVQGTTAYVISRDNNSLEAINIADKDNPIHIASAVNGVGGIQLSVPRAIAASGNYIYVATEDRVGGTWQGSLQIFQLTSGGQLQPRGRIFDNCQMGYPVETDPACMFPRLKYPIGLASQGNYAYVLTKGYTGDSQGLQVIDVRDPANPVAKGYVKTDSFFDAATVHVDGDYAYIAGGRAGTSSSYGYYFTIVRIRDENSPTVVGKIKDSPTVKIAGASDVYVQGNYAYVVSSIDNSLEVINITDKANPRHEFTLTDSVSPNGQKLNGASSITALENRYLFISASGSNAVEVVDITNPAVPRHVTFVTNATNGPYLSGRGALASAGRVIYVASNASDSLQGLDVSPLFLPQNGAQDPSLQMTLPDETLKRYLFISDKNDDVIGVQIFSNSTTLSASDWYKKHFDNLGQFKEVSIGGYDAITNGNSYYINALNQSDCVNPMISNANTSYLPTPGSCVGNLHNNIYLFSINATAQQSTRAVFDKMIKSLQFNINISDLGYCSDGGVIDRMNPTTSTPCTTDFDCIDSNGQPLPGTGGRCANAKTKMLRDLARIPAIADAQQKLEDYTKNNVGVDYPDFAAGSYLKWETNSRWPSWGTLSGLLKTVKSDPVNTWAGCSRCANKVVSPTGDIWQSCLTDSNCPGAGNHCVAVDPQTCWDPSPELTAFICPQAQSVAGYKYNKDSNNYVWHEPLEYFSPSSTVVTNFVSSTHFSTAPICVAGNLLSPLGEKCGDGIINTTNEQCDPPGTARIGTIGMTGLCTGLMEATSTCDSTCQIHYGDCRLPATCGNGRIEPGEICDDGSLNGQYGHCKAPVLGLGGCDGFIGAYCGNNHQDFIDSNNIVHDTGSKGVNDRYLEACDIKDTALINTGFCQKESCKNGFVLFDHSSTTTWPFNSFPDNSISFRAIATTTQKILAVIGYPTNDFSVLNSDDNGSSWGEISGTRKRDEVFNDIEMVNDNIGWVVGNPGILYELSGVSTANYQFVDRKSRLSSLGGNNLNLLDLHFVDANKGWISGYKDVVTTIVSPPDLFGRTTTYTSTFTSGVLLYTSNAGVSWQDRSNLITTNSKLHHIFFLNPNLGWAVAENGSIFKTTNGGTSWTEWHVTNNTSVSLTLKDIYFVTDKIGWVVGYDGAVYKTLDGGEKWLRQAPPKYDFERVYFSDSNNGWVFGSLGTLLRTDNGGLSWYRYTSKNNGRLRAIKFLGANSGFVAGDKADLMAIKVDAAYCTGTTDCQSSLGCKYADQCLANDTVAYHSDKGKSCAADCQGSGGYCGDGGVQAPYEECDYKNDVTCNSFCLKKAVVVGSVQAVTPGVCGNAIKDSTEECDAGEDNGSACTPTYGARCQYCSPDCKTLYVDPTAYCGNVIVDPSSPEVCDIARNQSGVETILRPDSSVTSPPYGIPVLCSQVPSLNPLLPGNSLQGGYSCRNNCTALSNNCVACGIKGVTVGGTIPKIAILNPVVNSVSSFEMLNQWGFSMRVGFYFGTTTPWFDYAPFATGSDDYAISHNLFKNLTFNLPNNATVFSAEANYGIETNLLCSNAYKIRFDSRQEPLLPFMINRTASSPTDDLRIPGDFFEYPVNNEVVNVNKEVVVSPAVPQKMIRAVVRWTDEEKKHNDASFLGSVYQRGLGTNDNPDPARRNSLNPYSFFSALPWENLTRNLTGTMRNGADFFTGKSGFAFNFHGGSQTVTVNNDPNLNFSGAITVEAWVRPTTTLGQYPVIFAKNPNVSDANSIGNGQGAYMLLVDNDRFVWRFKIRLANGTEDIVEIASDVSETINGQTTSGRVHDWIGKWVHITVMYDPSSNNPARIYLNGIDFSSPFGINTQYRGDRVVTNGNFNIGNFADGSQNNGFTGDVDELAIYDRVLTTEEIKSIVDAGQNGKCKVISGPDCLKPFGGAKRWHDAGLRAWWGADGHAYAEESGVCRTMAGSTLLERQGYYVPSTCSDYNGIMMHDAYGLQKTFTHSVTIDGLKMPANGTPYAFIVSAITDSTSSPIGSFVNSNLRVELYEYHEGQNPMSVWKPTRTFEIKKAADTSANILARYWHVFNLVRNGNDIQVQSVVDGGATNLNGRVRENGSIETGFQDIRCNIPGDACLGFDIGVSRSGTGNGSIVSTPSGINCSPTSANCRGTFGLDDVVNLVAAPSNGIDFFEWSGVCRGTSLTCTVTKDDVGNTATARFAPAVRLDGAILDGNLVVQPGGTYHGKIEITSSSVGYPLSTYPGTSSNFLGAGNENQSLRFAQGTVLSVKAVPDPGYRVSRTNGWLRDCAGTVGDTCELTLNTDKYFWVGFEPIPMYSLAVSKTGLGTVVSSPAGVNCTVNLTVCGAQYSDGTSVILTASEQSGYRFAGYTGAGPTCGSNRDCTVVMSAPKNITAAFTAITYDLTINATSGNGTGKVVSSPGTINCGNGNTACTYTFSPGTQISLQATPGANSSVTWDNCPNVNGNTCTLNAGDTNFITAKFNLANPTLNVSLVGTKAQIANVIQSLPSGGQMINCGLGGSVCSVSYSAGTPILLKATKSDNSVGWVWSGVACTSNQDCAFNLNVPITVTATFN